MSSAIVPIPASVNPTASRLRICFCCWRSDGYKRWFPCCAEVNGRTSSVGRLASAKPQRSGARKERSCHAAER